jgi:ATP-dependent DNA helicase RecQ
VDGDDFLQSRADWPTVASPMSHDLHATLRKHFGHKEFRAGQEQVMETLLAGRSALALFPTSAGKSLCYQLPALLMEGVTLVISPLIALMKDQVQALKARGIAAARLDSSLSAAEAMQVFDDMRDGTLKLLYIAPERLMNEGFIERLKQLKIAMMAVDEAHCISEWGHNFRPEYLRLALVAEELGIKPVLALTATATPVGRGGHSARF